jgi:para-aminobenzoate synthetase component I
MDPAPSLDFDVIPVPSELGGPVAVELAPAPDPWQVARRLAHLPHLLFLDSSEKHGEHGRYSYIAAEPDWMSERWVGRQSTEPIGIERLCQSGFHHRTIPGLPPFQGGVAGLFGYGLGRVLERIPPMRFDEFQIPDLATGVYHWVISFDHVQQRAWIVSTGFPHSGPALCKERATDRLRRVLTLLALPDSSRDLPFPCKSRTDESSIEGLRPQYPLPGFPGVTSNFDRAGYEAAVARAVEYIHAGDCFQVNLSQRLLAPLREHPLELYGRLRQLNAAPFAGYFDLGVHQILSASPERFLRVYPDGEVETRPIKGTRPRGATTEDDARLVHELAASPKDRAENVMIVDLLRNDIGKVCEYGSVRVSRVCEVESFRFVHHLVSEVRGKLRPGLGALDLLAAAFPGGSVTGAPKVRAMEIIAELEPTARGAYCGCLGWIGFDGAMDTNILIRTFTASRGCAQFPVGGGIVADSVPAREYEETLHKAEGLLRALGKN